MRILIVSAVFPPEPLVSARTSADLAQALHERGHSVQVLAPYPSRPSGTRSPHYPRRPYWKESTPEGYEIVRCLAAVSTESRLLSRLWENLTFGLSAAWKVLWQRPKSQAIYANTWPLVAQGLLCLAARLRRIPLVLSIQDVYPESLVVQGRLAQAGWFYRFLQALDGWIARSSRAVVVISHTFADIFASQRRVAAENLHVIANWFDETGLLAELDALEVTGNPLRSSLGILPQAFLLVYAGNIGAAAGVEHLLEALAQLPEIEALHLLIAGEGSRLENCQRLAVKLGLIRVHFLSPWQPAETAQVLSAADLFLLPTQGAQAKVSLPSKLIYYLLAARPILCLAAPDSELEAVIQASGCGWVAPPGDPACLMEAIQQSIQSPIQERLQRGASGRAYALQHYSRQACLPRLVQIVEDAVN